MKSIENNGNFVLDMFSFMIETAPRLDQTSRSRFMGSGEPSFPDAKDFS